MATLLLLNAPNLGLALPGLAVRCVEIQPDKPSAREEFRRSSCFSDTAAGCPVGLGASGHELALEAAARRLAAADA